MRAISRTEAVDYANIVLESTEANSSERRLARYVLALETIVESLVRDAEQAAPASRPRPDLERKDRTCGTCGLTIWSATLREAYENHLEFRSGHPLLVHEDGGFSVITDGTLREIERPSSEVADRSSTGGNDPYSNA